MEPERTAGDDPDTRETENPLKCKGSVAVIAQEPLGDLTFIRLSIIVYIPRRLEGYMTLRSDTASRKSRASKPSLNHP